MPKQMSVVLYIVVMIALVVSADVLVLRHQFWARLLANICIVGVFGAFYLLFLKNAGA